MGEKNLLYYWWCLHYCLTFYHGHQSAEVLIYYLGLPSTYKLHQNIRIHVQDTHSCNFHLHIWMGHALFNLKVGGVDIILFSEDSLCNIVANCGHVLCAWNFQEDVDFAVAPLSTKFSSYLYNTEWETTNLQK